MKKGFIFDLDGTVYIGNKIIEGAVDAINTLKNRGDKVVFLTNKSISSRFTYVEKLNKMGINVNLDEVLNSNYILAKYLSERIQKDEEVLVIGEKPLFDELFDHKIKVTGDPKKAKYVVIGWDRSFSYEKINLAFQAWVNKAQIIATNPDRTCPVEEGQIPDCGAMIGAIEGATGESIMVIGKPSKIMADTVVNEVLKMNYDQCYMVGDRLETDIKMGNDSGMNSVLVMTGITTKEMLEKTVYRPSFVINSIKDIVNL